MSDENLPPISLDEERRRRRGDGGGLDWTNAARIPTSSGVWAAHNNELVRAQRSGDDWEWIFVAPLPEVIKRVVYRSGEHVTNVAYVLQFRDGPEILCSDRELADGSGWERLLEAVPAETKVLHIILTAIRCAAEEAVQVDASPCWHHGRLMLPPDPYGPPGYGALAGGEEEARETWEELAWMAVVNPNLALVLGAAIAGAFVSELELQDSPWLHLVGDSSKGKTTALTCAAAVLGDPAGTFATMNATSIGLSTYLGSLAVLPAVIDELGAASLGAVALEALGYRVAGGASRLTGTRDGGFRRGRQFRSVLLSSGNRSLTNVTSSPGLPARIVEIAGPLTSGRAEAERLRELALKAYGWPLQWLIDDPDVEGVRAQRARVLLALETDGGVLGRVASQLALFVAGAWRLAVMLGVPELPEAAYEAARAVLADAGSDLEERGRTMGERLLEAVKEAHAARPYAFPHPGATGQVRELEGYELSLGRIAVLPRALDKIAAASSIDDVRPGLRDLWERELLERDGKHLSKKVRLNGYPTRVYVFVLPGEGEEVYPPVPTSSPLPIVPLSWDVPTVPTVPTASRTRVRPRAREGGPSTLVDVSRLSSSDLAHLTDVARERERAEELRLAEMLDRPALGAYPKRGADSPCPIPTTPTGSSSTPSSTPPTASAPPTASPSGVCTTRGRSKRGLRRAIEREGAPLAEILEDARSRGAELVWITCDNELVTGAVPGWDVREAPDGRGWYGWPSDDKAAAVRVIVGAADPSPFAKLNSERRLGALYAFADAHGAHWAGSGGGTFQALLRASHAGPTGRRLADLGESVEPAVAARANFGEGHALAWDRAADLTRGAGACIYAHSFDRNGAYLAALKETLWGLGDPEHLGPHDFDPRERRPGWWCVEPPENWPADLPCLLTRSGMAPSSGRSLWITTPTAQWAARDAGVDLRVVHAWTWPSSVAYTRTVAAKLVGARSKLVANPSAEARVAYLAHKTVYSEGVNWWRANFHRSRVHLADGMARGPAGWRPNAQAQVAALARANLVRSFAKVGESSGVWPVAALRYDEVVYLSDEPDAGVFAASIGLPIGSELGAWKPSRSASVVRGEFSDYEPGSVRTALRRALGASK